MRKITQKIHIGQGKKWSYIQSQLFNLRITITHYLQMFVQALTINDTNTRQQANTRSIIEHIEEDMSYLCNTPRGYEPYQLLLTEEGIL